MPSSSKFYALVLGCLGLFAGCKDATRSSKAHPQSAPAQTSAKQKAGSAKEVKQDAALENLEHRMDDTKTTQKVDRIIDVEDAIQDAMQPTGPMYTPPNNNILKNWNNHQDNLSSPLNHNY
ncbi:hypothetical protein [Helicobacter salomonis]|uniref:hypothetical protein n=1 Tax=Helicobacter salomonis TaxID=56878 RepID=UPI000CF0E0CB|nr:hypothetical protein [Helicobacter salomonis]